MRFINSFSGRLIMALAIFASVIGIVRYASYKNFPIIHAVLPNADYGKITVARPLISFQSLAVIFADGKKFPAGSLAERVAKTGVAVAVIDTGRALQTLTGNTTHCIDADRITDPFGILSKWADAPKGIYSILAGISEGSVLPFLAASAKAGGASINLSVNFSTDLKDKIDVCKPISSKSVDGFRHPTSPQAVKGQWLAVWTDQPDNDTAVFVRGLSNAKTGIAPYDTPFDKVTIHEIQKISSEEHRRQANAVPTVPLSAKTSNSTVTFFYSGDGGWRDLDRDVGGIMAERGYPVVGVDTLRYFWSSKTVERVADDLSTMMKEYRSSWKAKRFVLAGYSFGADILPAVYNHLPKADQQDVDLLVLLALGKRADFEIHVSGWVGKSTSGFPILPELVKIPQKKILCIYGREEKEDSACTKLPYHGTGIIELPGGHHFDHNYPNLAKRIITYYHHIKM